MKIVALSSVSLLISVPFAWAGVNVGAIPVLDPPPRVLSLERPHEDWHVVTTIVLKIQPSTTPAVQRRFRWTSPQNGQLACNGTDAATHEADVPAGTSAIICTYQPSVGFSGVDTFTYDAAFFNDSSPPNASDFAQQATVTIEVRERGLRWEFKTNAATITSDSPDPQALAEIPSVLGGTSQDFLLTVNWQISRPGKQLISRDLARTSALLRRSDLAVGDSAMSRSANFLIETGVQSDAVAATVTDVGKSATTTGSTSSPATSTEKAVARRNMVMRGEVDFGMTLNADGIGRFAEIGGVTTASFSTVLDSNESFTEAVGRVLQIVPKERSAYRLDLGARFAIKEAHELDSTTLVSPGGHVEPPTNIENALLVEFTTRFDSSIMGVTTESPTGDSRRRWAIHAELSPELTFLPGHQAPTIGFDVSRAWSGGPPAVKVTYGVNLSASKGIFK